MTPWVITTLVQPRLLFLWALGAVVGELWILLLQVDLDNGRYMALLSTAGAALGLIVPWILLLLLLSLFLLECDAFLLCLRPGREATPTAALGTALQSSPLPVMLFISVAEAVNDQGYPDVTTDDVFAVHVRLQQGEKPTDSIGQVIAWALWYRLNNININLDINKEYPHSGFSK